MAAARVAAAVTAATRVAAATAATRAAATAAATATAVRPPRTTTSRSRAQPSRQSKSFCWQPGLYHTIGTSPDSFLLMDIKRVELSGKLPGLQAELEWSLENGQKVLTLFLAVIKDKEVMVIAAHTQNGMKQAKKFVDTLKF